MLNLRKTIASLTRGREQWEKLKQDAGVWRVPGADVPGEHLEEIRDFGSNPGNLRMFSYRPARLPADPALVVVLHGCTQTAAGYDHGAGWSTLADRYGFALLLPEQQRSNNQNLCFNWFETGDTQRGRGEALSIRQMVEKIAIDQDIDPHRVFITGLSAGGAMASAMLACYPEVFAGGAIIAGLPYRAASNVQQAFESMFQCPTRPAPEWGALVRAASPHKGPWPRISVWHGDADKTVIPSNAREILKQWTNVHGLAMTPSGRAMVDGYPRQVWVDQAGDELIESYAIPNMAHGAPLATGAAENQCGATGPFLLEVGISSSYHIAKFFRLTAPVTSYAGSTKNETFGPGAEWRRVGEPAALPGQQHRQASRVQEGEVLEGEVLEKEHGAEAGPSRDRPSPAIDIGAVINKALKAAGLIRGQ